MNFGWRGKKFCHICNEETEWDYQRATVIHTGYIYDLMVPVCKKCGNEVGMPKQIHRRITHTETATAQV